MASIRRGQDIADVQSARHSANGQKQKAPGFRVSRCSPGMTDGSSLSFQQKLESRGEGEEDARRRTSISCCSSRRASMPCRARVRCRQAADAAVKRAQEHRNFANANVKAQLRPPIELTRAEADLARRQVGARPRRGRPDRGAAGARGRDRRDRAGDRRRSRRPHVRDARRGRLRWSPTSIAASRRCGPRSIRCTASTR